MFHKKYSNKILYCEIRSNIILLVVRLIGTLGIDLLHFSERLVNKRSEEFFLNFLTNEVEPVGVVDMTFTNDAKKFKKILVQHFGIGKLSNNLMNFLTDLYLSRVEGREFIMDVYNIDNLIRQFELNRLRIDENFLLSKIFSKLGRFVLSYEIETRVIASVDSEKFKSIYELFQFIKVKFYNSPIDLKAYLKELKLINHFNKFYSYDFFLNKLEEVDINADIEKIHILGPLRDDLSDYKTKRKPLILIKPNLSEIEFIKSNKIKNAYLYSHIPIMEFSKNRHGIINVVDYNKRNNSNHLITISYISNFLLLNGFPQHLQRVLLHQIFQTDNLNFNLNFFTFFLSDKQYSDNYLYNAKPISVRTPLELHRYVWGNGWHSFLSNFRFIKFIEKNGFISSDTKQMENLLKLNLAEYALQMERFYKFK